MVILVLTMGRKRPAELAVMPASNGTGRLVPLQTARQNIITARVKTKLWLEVDGHFVIGDGGLRLLDGVDRRGSLAEAVREIGWSYRHAWGYLRHAERVLGSSLVIARAGRGAARGMALTPVGRLLLERLRELRNRVDLSVGPSGPTADDIAARGQVLARRDRRGRLRG
jgi:molybdate transport system regulatory protein